ncbi:MAG: hypothetical protein ISQ90_07760 [Rhodospirillales bacterium]|nr:hypothetical protein [Rhodospirillales bacterium]
MKNVVAKFDSKRRKIRDNAWVVDLRSTKIKTLNGKKFLSRNFFQNTS